MTNTDFYALLFNPGEGICLGKAAWDNRIYPLEDVLTQNWVYFSINPFLIDTDLNKMHLKWSPGKGRRDQINLTARRNMLFEFDKISREDQVKVLKETKFPFSTLVWSGGKSHHAIISFATSFTNKEEYTAYWLAIAKVLKKFGVDADSQCKDPGRFSRCPGSIRIENNQEQKLISVKARRTREEIDAWLETHGVKPQKLKSPKEYVPLVDVSQKDTQKLWAEAVRLTERKQKWEPGNRHNFRFALAINCNRVRLNPEEAKSLINTYFWKENDTTVFDALKWETKQWVVFDKTEKQRNREKARELTDQKFTDLLKKIDKNEDETGSI